MALAIAPRLVRELRAVGRRPGRNEYTVEEITDQTKGQTMTKLTLKTEGDKQVVVTRRFAASPDQVYRAHIEPEIIKKWMLGPDGWTMPVCINDARPGGKIRYEWTNGQGGGFYLTGEFIK